MTNYIFTKKQLFSMVIKRFREMAGGEKAADSGNNLFKQAMYLLNEIPETAGVKINFEFEDNPVLKDDRISFCNENFYSPGFKELDSSHIKSAVPYIMTLSGMPEGEDSQNTLTMLLKDILETAFLDCASELFKTFLKKKTERYISPSFGPGYYGMDLDTGETLYKITDGKSLGISLNESGLLIPEKSCTGFFLISDKEIKFEKECVNCIGNQMNCSLCSISNTHKTNESSQCNLAVACDIGTTNLVCRLYNLNTGELIKSVSMENPQRIYGRDVITRQALAMKGEKETKLFHNILTEGINKCIEDLCRKSGADVSQIKKIAAGGNTTMSHFLMGYSVEGISKSPFRPVFEKSIRIKAGKTGIIPEDAELFIPGNLGGHVGSDITAGLVNDKVYNYSGLCVYLDMGTNGEIVLKNGENFIVTSVAAGPVFEGGYLSCGTSAVEGAVTKVEIGRNVEIETIGNAKATGICGSGIISAISQLIKAGIIDKNGTFESRDNLIRKYTSKNILDRLNEDENSPVFYLCHDLWITQDDIRKFQVAKAAIRAGIITLLSQWGKTESDIEKIFVSGAFGKGLCYKDMVNTGIIPDVETEYIENGACNGLSHILLDKEYENRAERIWENRNNILLNEKSIFEKKYIEYMSF